MLPYLRLRQICLVAPHLDASSALIRALLGVEEGHRDAGVAKYGLENVLFPIGPDRFLEVVAPTRPGTAAGRFLEQTQGRGGYMLIFDCDDPKVRAQRAQALGVRLVNHIDRERYQGYQLHPKDCRATFLEFNHTPGGQALHGPYWPAGEHWQRHVRADVTRHLKGVEVLSRDASGLAAHWSSIMGVPVTRQDGWHVINVGEQTITIISAPGSPRERLDAMVLVVRGATDILARARQMGLETHEDAFTLCGMWMRVREEAR
ncbi:MAG TPA: VOC family protein [Hyphomicrobiaceae bacterium]|nr:VOC family protein [Hyphomicrobiaceae bacterium]